MTKKDYFVILVFVVALALAYAVCTPSILKSRGLQEKLNKSDSLVAVYELEIKRNTLSFDSLKCLSDSLFKLSEKEPQTRVIIKNIYDKKKFSVLRLDGDSAVLFSAKWLSEADTL